MWNIRKDEGNLSALIKPDSSLREIVKSAAYTMRLMLI